MAVPWGGDKVAFVSPELAAAFKSGDRLLVVDGALLHVPAGVQAVAAGAVAKKWLREHHGITFRGCMTQLGELPIAFESWDHVPHNPFFAPVADVQALIGAAPAFAGAGILVPVRNAELFRWCLENGLRVVQPMTLMSMGLYNEPKGSFLPSVRF